MRVIVLGAGFGGLELTTKLSEEFGGDVEIVLIDKTDAFVFGFSKLDVMFGRTTAEHVRHRYADIVKPGVEFVQAEINAIDAERKTVQTSAGEFAGDFLVIALGADYDIAATPGLGEHGHDFYTEEGAFAVREAIESFAGGDVLVGVRSAPFKCPPAPSEAVLLMHEYLAEKGLRDASTITLAMPFGRPIPPSPDASAALLEAFAEHDIVWRADTPIVEIDGAQATTGDGEKIAYDLFLGVPHHVAPKVLVDSGLTEDGWVPVDPKTLATKHPGVYAIGDVAAVGTPRAGVFAEGQGRVAAEQIAAAIRSGESGAIYDGHGVCYIEFGGDTVGKVDVTFFGDQKLGILMGPDPSNVADKAEFGTSRAKRWFGSDWVAV